MTTITYSLKCTICFYVLRMFGTTRTDHDPTITTVMFAFKKSKGSDANHTGHDMFIWKPRCSFWTCSGVGSWRRGGRSVFTTSIFSTTPTLTIFNGLCGLQCIVLAFVHIRHFATRRLVGDRHDQLTTFISTICSFSAVFLSSSFGSNFWRRCKMRCSSLVG